MFNFPFSSLCVPLRHRSDWTGVSNESLANDSETSAIKQRGVHSTGKPQQRFYKGKVFRSLKYAEAEFSEGQFSL